MNKKYLLCVIVGIGCFLNTNAMDKSLGYYLSFLEDGPLKTGCENCPTGCFFKTEQEKARVYIVEWLRKHDTPEADKPMTNLGGWLGDAITLLGMAANDSAMKSAIWKLMPPETNDLVVRQELKKVSEAGAAISRKRRSNW